MKHRLQFTVKKLLRMALLLLGVSLAAFLLMSASPLDPLQTNVGQTALGSMSQEQVEKLEEYWGVDTPPAERYLGWLQDVLHGDFGTSLLYRQPVLTVIGQRLANSFWLLLAAWIISGVLGLALGVIAGAFRGRWPDRLIRGYCLLISSTPAFWLAILLLLVFSVWLGWFPVGLSVPAGMDAAAVTLADRLRHAVLPALTLSITGVANIALHTREKMADVMESDYVLFARARGEKVAFTRDTHGAEYLATQEGKRLPVPHCIRGEKGWQIADGLYVAGDACFDKPCFGSVALAQYVSEEKFAEAELIGVCTDICVISNALLLKAFCPETEISVRADCCAGVTPESHQTALSAMCTCQIKIV